MAICELNINRQLIVNRIICVLCRKTINLYNHEKNTFDFSVGVRAFTG